MPNCVRFFALLLVSFLVVDPGIASAVSSLSSPATVVTSALTTSALVQQQALSESLAAARFLQPLILSPTLGVISAAAVFARTGQMNTQTGDVTPAKPVILVAEDEEEVQTLLRLRVLKDFLETHDIFMESDGHAALDRYNALTLAGRQVVLLVTDVNMPQGEGDELVDEIFKIQPDLQVIFQTGNPQQINRFENIANVQIIEKTKIADLRTAVRSVLARAADDDTPGLAKELLGGFMTVGFALRAWNVWAFDVWLAIGVPLVMIAVVKPQWLRAAKQAVTRALKNVFLNNSEIATAYQRAA